MPTQTFYNLPREKQERIMDAALNEMGQHTFEHLNIANIIRESDISRGSFYQYFSDKRDLYMHFYQYIYQKKYEFYGDLFNTDYDIPFLERFHQIYIKGYDFAMKNPKLVKAGRKVISSNQFMHSQMLDHAMKQGIELFSKFISKDQQMGRIRASLDPDFLAAVMLEVSNKVTFEEYIKDDMDPIVIEKKIQDFIEIFKKGIE
ncbi:MAG: TetR/AcrR family transcriptional regulator [Acholeplasmataceae bacterium]|nr:TetR/AcrR family transcriptional regulator [Acholeplasmataceae bacterium]